MTEPVPQRIGDAERDRAAELLREHHAAGRLDAVEFDERVTRVLGAKTAADLEPLFVDLPGERPDAVALPTPAPASPKEVTPKPDEEPPTSPGQQILMTMAGFSWPVVIIAIVALGGGAWWALICLPIILYSLASRGQQKPPPQRALQ